MTKCFGIVDYVYIVISVNSIWLQKWFNQSVLSNEKLHEGACLTLLCVVFELEFEVQLQSMAVQWSFKCSYLSLSKTGCSSAICKMESLCIVESNQLVIELITEAEAESRLKPEAGGCFLCPRFPHGH